MTNEDLIAVGFEPIPHFTIGNSVTYDLGRNRYLSATDVGNPNEMLFICEHVEGDHRQTTDAIVLHNFDYDGYLTMERLQMFLSLKSKK